MTSCTERVRRGFWEIWEKLVELRTRLRTWRVDVRGSLRPDEYVRCERPTCWGAGADVKASIERLCISLPYDETFNSKVIKGFVPELRNRYVFFVFRDSFVLCIYVLNIICTFHISVSDYVTMHRQQYFITWKQYQHTNKKGVISSMQKFSRYYCLHSPLKQNAWRKR